MPLIVINNECPFTLLKGYSPDYTWLQAFGFACFPYLRPYQQHKFDFHTTKCVFIGYSNCHKGYRCLSSTRKEFISRHVYFNEKEFLYSFLFDKTETMTNSSSILSWIPIPNTTPPLHHPCNPQTNTDNTCDQPNLPVELSSTTSIASPTTIPTNTYTLNSPSNDTTPSTPSSPIPMAVNTHPMTTRTKVGIFKTRKPYGYLAQLQGNQDWSKLEPTLYREATSSNQWQQVMDQEFHALQRNHTWDLVPPNPNQHIVPTKWVYKIKRDSAGHIQRYRARLIAKGYLQTPDIDYGETYSLVIEPTSIRGRPHPCPHKSLVHLTA